MKKLLSVILCLSLVFSFGTLMASASDELIVDVVTDLHYDDDSVKGFTKPVNPDDPYAHVASSGQLYVESLAVISAFLEKAAADCNVTLPGYTDLVEGPAPELSFGEKIKAFFIKIFSFIMSIFAFI